MLREEGVKDETEIGGRYAGQVLDQLGQAEQEEQDEWNGGEQRVERQAARQEGDVAFISGLQDAAEKPQRREVPADAPRSCQASGSS